MTDGGARHLLLATPPRPRARFESYQPRGAEALRERGRVRIEDVIMITKDGYHNFTTVRSDVEWVEGVCSGEL